MIQKSYSLKGLSYGYLKVSKFQNEYMKSSFLPKYEPKIVRTSTLNPDFLNEGMRKIKIPGDFRIAKIISNRIKTEIFFLFPFLQEVIWA